MSNPAEATPPDGKAPDASALSGHVARPVWSVRAARAAWALVAAGIVLRLIRYAANRSLWLDEAYLAESILTYTFGQLATEELMHWQAAPVGFLLIEKLAVSLFGTGEYALRLFPLICGVSSVPLFHAVARRALPAAGALVALTLFALVEPLVYYSAEVKQYGTDVAVALLIVWLAHRVLDRSDRLARLTVLAGVGSASLFLSHPAVFVLAAAGLVLLASVLRRGLWRPSAWLALAGAAWVALIAFNYVTFLRPLTQHPGLVAYWSAGYMPWDAGAAPWIGRALYGVFTDYRTMWLPLAPVPALAAVFGLVWLWRHNRPAGSMLVLPIAFALVAAAMHRFPFTGRVILFVVPLVLLLVGAGAHAVLGSVPRRRQFIRMAFLLLLVGPSVGLAAFFAARPPGREEMKAVLAHVRDRKQPGDLIYVINISGAPFRYYRDRYGLGPDRFGLAGTEWVLGNQVEPSEAALAAELGRLRGRQRVWVLLTHMRALGGPDEVPIVRSILDRWGTRLDEHAARGARVMLYDLGEPPASAQSRRPL